MEVLWRRGCIDPAVETLPTNSEARAIAKDMPDFKNELSEIEIQLNSIGVEVVFTPKGHCEISSRGIEHTWGVSKAMFRKQNALLTTEQRTKDLKIRVRQLLESVPIETIGKCARRAREHKLYSCNCLRS